MIEAKDINKYFGEHHVLKNISCRFKKGKTNLIIGQSGSGKTVLVKCLVGLYEVDSGMVLYDDRNFSEMNTEQRKKIRREIGMLFQMGALFDMMTVEENVMFPLNMFTSQSMTEKQERVNFVLKRVNLEDSNKLMLSIGDQVNFIYKGELWWKGTKDEILQTENKELNDFVFGTELTSRLKNHRA